MPRGRFNFVFAISVFLGTIVGAGIFGLPYAVFKSGLAPGLFYFLILGGVLLLIHLFFAEITLRTKDGYGLVGFGQKYLGNWGRVLITFSVIVATVGVLLAYLILVSDFLKILFSPFSSLPVLYFALFFWLFSSFFVFRGIKFIAPLELLTNLLFFLAIFLIFIFSLPKFNLENFTIFNPSNIFLPYGIILFSLVGWSALPEVIGILKSPEEKRDIKKIIVVSTAIVIAFYLLFTLAVIAVAGSNVSPDAISGLLPFLGSKIIFLGALAGAITVADSFLVLALYLRNTFIFNFKFSKIGAGFVVSLLPLILYLIGLRSFISVIGFVGTIIGVIEGIIIILIFQKAKTLGDREPEYSLKVPSVILHILILIFLFGALAQLFLI